MNYGFEPPTHPVAKMFGSFFGGVAGIVGACLAFFSVMLLARMLADALPRFSGETFTIVYLAFACLPLAGCRAVLAQPMATHGARAMAIVGAVAFVVLSAGELTGLLRLYPENLHFFIVPAAPARETPQPHVRHAFAGKWVGRVQGEG